EAADRDVDFVGQPIVLEDQGRAAGCAKGARGYGGRPDAHRSAGGKAETGPRQAHPSDRRRSAHAPTDRAVAEGLVPRLALRLKADCAAKAAPGVHAGSPPPTIA